jgi:hypothetical protein
MGPDPSALPKFFEFSPPATNVQLCASEESKQHQKDITRILQQHEEEQKKWAQQVSPSYPCLALFPLIIPREELL